MKRRALASLGLVVTAVALLGLSANPAPAQTANHYIHMRSLAYPLVGQPATISIDGVVAPPAEYWDSSWIEVVALPASLGECPGDAQSAGAIAEQTGVILAIAMRPNVDEAGNFANSVGFTPTRLGPLLFCGYLYNEVGYTWAAAGLRLEVVGPTGPGGSTGSRPVNLKRPWVTRSGRRLVCHPGTWSNVTGPFAYNWLLDGHPTKVTGRHPFGPGPAGRGHRVACRVTAYGAGGSSAAATSPPLRLGCGCARQGSVYGLRPGFASLNSQPDPRRMR